jgi:hypothetical protein
MALKPMAPNKVAKIPNCAAAPSNKVLIQPPIMRALTTQKERQIKMVQLREVSTAEKIIFPVIGLILFLPKAFISFAINNPHAVPIAKATMPSTRIPSVSGCKTLSALGKDQRHLLSLGYYLGSRH